MELILKISKFADIQKILLSSLFSMNSKIHTRYFKMANKLRKPSCIRCIPNMVIGIHVSFIDKRMFTLRTFSSILKTFF